MLELLVVATSNGAQPMFLSMVKAPIGAGFTQIVLIRESVPHFGFPLLNLMVYFPTELKFIITGLVADGDQLSGLFDPLSVPKLPLLTAQPTNGEIVHTNAPVVQSGGFM